jgi:uncharacterized glyoxalase superfamily protein PhnB
LTRALGATVRYKLEDPDTKQIGHTELAIGDSVFMLGRSMPEMGCSSVKTLGGSPVGFYLYVDDCDAAFANAVKAGAQVKESVREMFWGDRVGSIVDPEGFVWSLATHTRDLSPEQITQGFAQFKKELAGAKK